MAAPTSGYQLNSGSNPFWRVPLTLGASSFTIDHWLYLDNNNNNRGLMGSNGETSTWNSAGLVIYIRSAAGGGYGFHCNGSVLRVGTPPVGQWTHVAWVHTGTQARVYENGVLVGQGAMPLPNHVVNHLHASWNGGTSESIHGQVARLRQWDRALTVAEIEHSRDNAYLGTPPGLLSEFTLDSGQLNESPSSLAQTTELLGNSSSTAVLSGQAVAGPSGDPVEYVQLIGTRSRGRVFVVKPDAEGNWTVTVPTGEYMVTYFAAGFSPETHGPYVAEAD